MHPPAAPAPLPEQLPTLNYAHAPQLVRPGIVTAMGIMSIIVSGLGILVSLLFLLTFGPFLMMSYTMGPAAFAGGLPGGSVTPAGAITQAEADQIAQALATVQPMSQADQDRLASALMRTDIPLAPPIDGEGWTTAHVAPQVGASSTDAFGVMFSFQGGNIFVAPAQLSITTVGANATTTTSSFQPDGTMTRHRMNPSTLYFGILRPLAITAAEVVSLGLAVMLLVAGIMTLRDSPRALRLHRTWAVLKLVMVILGSAAAAWWAIRFFGGLSEMMQVETTAPDGTVSTGNMSPTGAVPAILAFIVGAALVSALYPIAVLIVTHTRPVREHFQRLQRLRAEWQG